MTIETGASMNRHYGMDWLRIAAFALLIFYHIGMYFVWWDWHVKSAEPVGWATLPMLATNSWRLPLLFAVAGFASAAVLGKTGGRLAFLRSRSARLLIPLVFAMAVIVAPQPWVELMFKHGYTQNFWHFWAHDYFRFAEIDGIAVPTWQHLWFVAYLWVYTMIVGLLLFLLPSRARDWTARAADRALAGPLILALPIALLILKEAMLGDFEETHALVDDWGLHAVYFPVFLFGMLLWRAGPAWAAVRRWWKLAAALALAGFAAVAGFELSYPGDTPFPPALEPVWELARIAQGWGAIVALIGIADAFWNREHRTRPMLTEAIFPFYIIHQTIIVLVGWWLLPAGLPNGAAFAILVAATVGGCWAFYRAGRAIGPLRPVIGLSWKDRLDTKPIAAAETFPGRPGPSSVKASGPRPSPGHD